MFSCPGILRGFRTGREELWRLAVSGLAVLATDDAEKLIKGVLKRSDGALHQRCVQAMVELRRRQRGAGR